MCTLIPLQSLSTYKRNLPQATQVSLDKSCANYYLFAVYKVDKSLVYSLALVPSDALAITAYSTRSKVGASVLSPFPFLVSATNAQLVDPLTHGAPVLYSK